MRCANAAQPVSKAAPLGLAVANMARTEHLSAPGTAEKWDRVYETWWGHMEASAMSTHNDSSAVLRQSSPRSKILSI